MKYIDESLSYSNLKLLNAWIDRRLSGAVFPDIRDEKAKVWWSALMRQREHAKCRWLNNFGSTQRSRTSSRRTPHWGCR